ncbi:MAG: hypothetical protein M1829_004977 [Trizodia sp. TS-e1964]|nr:MAG: hypothetical protein M1829_004977 [Trizodia sp. TS-e1964]
MSKTSEPSSNRSSYLPVGLSGLSPWGSRSTTPKPNQSEDDKGAISDGAKPSQQQGGDHVVSRRHRLSLKKYPLDCPPLNARWFYAADVSKRKPLSLNPKPAAGQEKKPIPIPKKFIAFSARDSRSIESAFQKLADQEDYEEQNGRNASDQTSKEPEQNNTSINDSQDTEKGGRVKVPVNEDYLFDVDIEQRELAPAYWLGPIYEVRRGTWFFQDGSGLRPCDENLGNQLEQGYLKVMPFRRPVPDQATPKPTNSVPPNPLQGANENRPQSSSQVGSEPGVEPIDASKDLQKDDMKATEALIAAHDSDASSQQAQAFTYRLFGSYMGSVVTYQDSNTAWLLTDDFMSRMSSTVYERFAGGGHLGGTKIVRGYSETSKSNDVKIEGDVGGTPGKSAPKNGNLDAEISSRSLKRRSAPTTTYSTDGDSQKPKTSPEIGSKRRALERNMTYVIDSNLEDPEKQEEEARKRDEKEIEDDYKDEGSEDQGREIEHLLLVTHGIGQRLSLRTETVNFVYDVNVLRKTLKGVYANSPDLQALNDEVDKLPKNCRVQVLPVCWRHLLDFPRQSLKQNRKEHDLGDIDSFEEEEEYPSLADITVDGVPAIRTLIADLGLDILLYQSAYREHISGIVLRECNRIHQLFLERNPYFKGRVSLVGHSLGSAILFDILCRQKEDLKPTKHSNEQSKFYHNRPGVAHGSKEGKDISLNFDVEDFFCLGSPIGLFQMLKGRTIAGRTACDFLPAESPLDPDSTSDPFLNPTNSTSSARSRADRTSQLTQLPFTVSSPKCRQLYNIFHPTDPISYRIEPLISTAMASLKPQPLPYTKKGIFGPQMGQGLTGIGARVGQSVTGLWTSFSTGIASSILNRHLGFTGDDGKGEASAAITTQQTTLTTTTNTLSPAAGTNIVGAGVISTTTSLKSQSTVQTRNADPSLQTLYSGFKARRLSANSSEPSKLLAQTDAAASARKLLYEESKIRALNSTGRVDFSIQE